MKKQLALAVIILLLSTIGIFAGAKAGLLSVTEETKPDIVYVPTFMQGLCGIVSGRINEPIISDMDSSTGQLIKNFWKGDREVTKIDCKTFTKKCVASLNILRPVSFAVGKCPLGSVISSENDLINKCDILQPWESHILGLPKISFGKYSFNFNEKFYSEKENLVIVSTATLPGILTIDMTADIYDLVTFSSNTPLTITKGSCSFIDFASGRTVGEKDFKELISQRKIGVGNQIGFGDSFSYIESLVPVFDSSKIAKYKDGRWVFIESPGWISPLEKTINGDIYVDSKHKENAPDIICLPLSYGGDGKQCSIDGTKWESKAVCNWYGGGSISGRVAKGTDLCLTKCSSGNIEYYDCVKVIECKEGYTFDPERKECIKSGGGGVVFTKGCKTSADCNDDKWWTSDTCEKTWQNTAWNEDGQCKFADNTGIYLILGVILIIVLIIGIIFVVKKE